MPALVVAISDGRGLPLSSRSGLRVIAREDNYADTVNLAVDAMSTVVRGALAYERPGLYSVEVSAVGYWTATVADVGVGSTPDGCHVNTQRVNLQLRGVRPRLHQRRELLRAAADPIPVTPEFDGTD